MMRPVSYWVEKLPYKISRPTLKQDILDYRVASLRDALELILPYVNTQIQGKIKNYLEAFKDANDAYAYIGILPDELIIKLAEYSQELLIRYSNDKNLTMAIMLSKISLRTLPPGSNYNEVIKNLSKTRKSKQ
jgi:hypothetical protein